MKIISVVIALMICFSAATADAFSAVLHGFIKLPQTANLTPDNVTIYVVGKEQKTTKPDSVSWFSETAGWGFAVDTDNMYWNEVPVINGESVVAVVTHNGLKGFSVLTYNNKDGLQQFEDIVSFAPCQIYQSVQSVVCGK
jgi:hypothetical protein